MLIHSALLSEKCLYKMKLILILGPVQELGLRGSRYSIKRSLRNQLFLGEVGKDGTGFSGNAHLYCGEGGMKRKSFGWEDRR